MLTSTDGPSIAMSSATKRSRSVVFRSMSTRRRDHLTGDKIYGFNSVHGTDLDVLAGGRAEVEGGAELGEPCDSDPNDNIPGDTCANEDLCVGGYCSALCDVDSDCNTDADQKCTVIEFTGDYDDDGETDFIQDQLINVTITEMATAGLPDRINGSGTSGLVGLREARRHIRAEPGESAAETHAALRALTHPSFEELGNQHAAAQSGGAHGLTENTGEAAAVSGRVDLKLSLRLHQMQGWANRHQRTQTRPLQGPVVLSHRVRGTMAWREAGGHLGCSHPGNPGRP